MGGGTMHDPFHRHQYIAHIYWDQLPNDQKTVVVEFPNLLLIEPSSTPEVFLGSSDCEHKFAVRCMIGRGFVEQEETEKGGD